MSDNTYTPGPWIAGWDGGKSGPTCPAVGGVTVGDKEYLPVGYNRETIAIVVAQDCVRGALRRGQLVANANLIAAAPDLYEALEMVRDADNDCSVDEQMPEVARAKIDRALAKAKGEDQ